MRCAAVDWCVRKVRAATLQLFPLLIQVPKVVEEYIQMCRVGTATVVKLYGSIGEKLWVQRRRVQDRHVGMPYK